MYICCFLVTFGLGGIMIVEDWGYTVHSNITDCWKSRLVLFGVMSHVLNILVHFPLLVRYLVGVWDLLICFFSLKWKSFVFFWLFLDVDFRLFRQLIFFAESYMSQKRANHYKTQFVSHLSHEIRTPLTGVIGWSEVLREKLKEQNEELQEIVDTILISAQTLFQTISGILDFQVREEMLFFFPLIPLQKINKGELDIQSVPINLINLMENIHKSFMFLGFEKQGPRVSFICETEGITQNPYVLGDPLRFFFVFFDCLFIQFSG